MNDMKKGLILVLFALVSVVSYSQISWNAKVGMNMSNFTGDMDTDMKIGFNVGVGMEYQFTEMWSIQPSLMLTTKGAKTEDSFTEDGASVKLEETYNPMYLELPIMAAARFAISDNMNIVISAGPYLAYGIGGKYKVKGSASYEGESASETEKTDIFGDDGFNRFDFGLGVGAALEINKFFVGLNGEFGLTKLVDGDGAPKNTNFSIGVGYKF